MSDQLQEQLLRRRKAQGDLISDISFLWKHGLTM